MLKKVVQKCSFFHKDSFLAISRLFNLGPKTLRGARAQGNLGEATLETRGEILGWTDTGGKWMWAHRCLSQTLGL